MSQSTILSIATILNSNNSKFVALQMKSNVSDKLRKNTKKISYTNMFEKAFPNGLNRISTVSGALVGGTDYSTYMSNKIGSPYVAKKASGRVKVDGYSNVFRKDDDINQMYLQLYVTNATNAKSVYINDLGEIISAKYVEENEACFLASEMPTKRREKSKKQKDDAKKKQQTEKPILTYAPKFETIQFLKCGENSFGEKIITD
jgi:hypothetical protein